MLIELQNNNQSQNTPKHYQLLFDTEEPFEFFLLCPPFSLLTFDGGPYPGGRENPGGGFQLGGGGPVQPLGMNCFKASGILMLFAPEVAFVEPIEGGGICPFQLGGGGPFQPSGMKFDEPSKVDLCADCELFV